MRVESEVLAAEAAGFELLSVFEAWGRVKKATDFKGGKVSCAAAASGPPADQ